MGASRGGIAARDRGVSEVLGIVILLGMALAGAALVVYFGAGLIDGFHTDIQEESAEQSIREFDSRLAEVGFGENVEHTLAIDAGPDQEVWIDDDAEMMVGLYGDDEPCEVTMPMGSLHYGTGDSSVISYQGGGIWEATDDGTRMLSSPDLYYNDGTMAFPSVNINGSVERAGDELHASVDEEATVAMSDAYSETLLECPDADALRITVTSRYAEAWGAYLEREVTEDVEYDLDASDRDAWSVQATIEGGLGALTELEHDDSVLYFAEDANVSAELLGSTITQAVHYCGTMTNEEHVDDGRAYTVEHDNGTIEYFSRGGNDSLGFDGAAETTLESHLTWLSYDRVPADGVCTGRARWSMATADILVDGEPIDTPWPENVNEREGGIADDGTIPWGIPEDDRTTTFEVEAGTEVSMAVTRLVANYSVEVADGVWAYEPDILDDTYHGHTWHHTFPEGSDGVQFIVDATEDEHPNNVRVLSDGDEVPIHDIDARVPLDPSSYLEPYLADDGTLELDDDQAVFLFELQHRGPESADPYDDYWESAFDLGGPQFNDLAILFELDDVDGTAPDLNLHLETTQVVIEPN